MNRRRRLLAWAGGLLCLAVTGMVLLPGLAPTLAAWNDREVAHGPVGVLDCGDAQGQFAGRGAGTMVSGSVLGTDLDSVAAVQDAEVLQDGEGSSTPEGDSTDPWDGFFAPLGVTALDFLDVGLGLIQIPLDTETGVIGQYGQAQSTGWAAGASGLVNDEGVIALEPGAGAPQLATLELSELLGSLDHDVASLVGEDVADVSLEVGAVAGRAAMDGCDAALSGARSGGALASGPLAMRTAELEQSVSREYLVSSLQTSVESPAVGGLVGGVEGVLAGLEETVNGLASDQGVLDQLTGSVSGLVGGLLGTLRLGDLDVSLTATIDLSGVRSFLTEDFGDSGGVLSVNPRDGTVTVDTAALLAAAYPGEYSEGLNGLPPNTDVLGDPAVLNALVAALGSALDDWLVQVQDLLTSALDAVHLSVEVLIDVSLVLLIVPVPVANVTATVDGSLADLLSGSVSAETNVGLLGIEVGLVNRLLAPLLGGLVNGLGQLVGTVVWGVLEPLGSLGSAVTSLVQPLVTAVSGVYSALFLDGLVSLTLNNQNLPLTAPGEGPPEWADLPEGQLDVSAVRLGILDAAGEAGVRLHLGRGSVGPVCLVDDASPPSGCPAG